VDDSQESICGCNELFDDQTREINRVVVAKGIGGELSVGAKEEKKSGWSRKMQKIE